MHPNYNLRDAWERGGWRCPWRLCGPNLLQGQLDELARGIFQLQGPPVMESLQLAACSVIQTFSNEILFLTPNVSFPYFSLSVVSCPSSMCLWEKPCSLFLQLHNFGGQERFWGPVVSQSLMVLYKTWNRNQSDQEELLLFRSNLFSTVGSF